MTVISLALLLAASCNKQDALELERLQASKEQSQSKTFSLPDAADAAESRPDAFFISSSPEPKVYGEFQ